MSMPPTNADKADAGRAPLPPLVGLKFIVMCVATAMASFIVLLDLTIANVSVPTISAGLGASPKEGTWVITSYAVADAITVLLSGWLSARFGTARVLVFALSAFGLASIMCGLSTSLDMLVLFRFLQGIAGGPALPLSQTLLLNNFPKDKPQHAMAIWTVTSVLGPISGPIIGGYICDNYTWPWLFLINAPIVILTAFAVWRTLRDRDAPPIYRPIDLIGMLLMAVSVASLQFMLDRGHDLDWFASPLIIGLLLVAIIGFVAFLIWELTEKNPFINLSLFRRLSFSVALLVLSTMFGPFFGAIIISPLWLQTNMNYTPTWAGIAASPTGITTMLMAPIVAWLLGRVDTRKLISAGLLFAAGTFFWRGHFNSFTTFEMVLLSQVGIGMGMSCVFAPSVVLAVSDLKAQEVAGANGLVAFVRTIAVAIATSSFVTYWQDATVRNRFGMVDRIEGANAVGQVGSAGLAHDQAIWHLDALVQTQAVMMATNDSYTVFAVVAFVGAFIIWLAPRPRGRGMKPARPTEAAH